MHSIFDKLTRTLSGDFMRRDDCCGGNGGEPAIPCCKPNEAMTVRELQKRIANGERWVPQRLNEREADSLISLLYGDKAAAHDAFIAESVITGRAVGVIDGAEFRHLPAEKVFVGGGDK